MKNQKQHTAPERPGQTRFLKGKTVIIITECSNEQLDRLLLLLGQRGRGIAQ